MKIIRLETFLTNSGLRNYLFVRLTTDTGLTGVGEASLEWQEQTVETLMHEWVEDRTLGADPFDIEKVDRRHDPRPVPGRPDGADGDQRRRNRHVGHRRQGLRPAGVQAARRPRSRPTAGLCQRLVRPGQLAARVCRPGPRGRRSWLPGSEVRSLWHGLEADERCGDGSGGGADCRRARGRGRVGRDPDRRSRPAVGRLCHRVRPSHRAVSARGSSRSRSRRTASNCSSRSRRRCRCRSRPANGCTRWRTSTGSARCGRATCCNPICATSAASWSARKWRPWLSRKTF